MKYKVAVFVQYIETDEFYALETRDVEAEYNGQAYQKVCDQCENDPNVTGYWVVEVIDVTRMDGK